ncbi:hypothetical protein [Bifidobacterium adolescentis]|uniref:hypothetical protein n=1 Tax=Bifidobacterium adolescentis TaxID=1680 RepID=UPI0011063599|nr:hypothetical protein [Bifidobacterium adolescentis]MDB0644160.1 hypothetical protein [Bifidobacterium adolescentis]
MTHLMIAGGIYLLLLALILMFNHGAHKIQAGGIVAGAVTTDKVVADAVTADKLAANSVQARHITALAVTTDKLAANSVTTTKLRVTEDMTVALLNAHRH